MIIGFDGLASSLPSPFFALAASANDVVFPPANAPKPDDDPPNAENALLELGGVFVGVVEAPNEGEPKVDFPKTGPLPTLLGDPNVGVVEPGFADDADVPLPPGPNAEGDPKALTVVDFEFENGEVEGVVLPNPPELAAGLKGDDWVEMFPNAPKPSAGLNGEDWLVIFPNAPKPVDGCEVLKGDGEGVPKGVVVVDACDGTGAPAFFASSEGDSCVSKSALSGLEGLFSGLDIGKDALAGADVGVKKAEFVPCSMSVKSAEHHGLDSY